MVRAAVLASARELGLRPLVQRLEPAALGGADEVFLCNSVMGLRSVARVVGEETEVELTADAVCRELAARLRAADLIP